MRFEDSVDVRLGAELEAVGVAENDLGERGTTTGVVDDLANNTASVSVALSVIELAELGGVLYSAEIR